MSSVINTNVSSLNSQRELSKSGGGLATALQRLSSGLRINSAKDDAAGMAISSRMSAQISGLTVAGRNANDGISLAQTAEGALQSVSDSLQRMRELAVQSSNATNSASDRAALQKEVDELVKQINNVSTTAAFNGVKLLDGSFNAQNFQIGANAGETLTVNSIASAKADALGVGTTSSYSTSSTGTTVKGAIGATGVTVNGFGVGPSNSDGVSAAGANASAIAKAAAFNAVSGVTGVSAKANAATVTGVAPTANVAIAGDATDYIFLNGVKLGRIDAGTGTSFQTQGSNVATAINAVSNQTGVTATFSTTNGAVTLTAADGRNISLIGSGTGDAIANSGLTITDAAAGFTTAASAAATGALAAGDLTINGFDVGAVTAGADVTAQGAAIAAAINALTSKTGVTATAASGVTTLTAAAGRDITIDGNSVNATTTLARTGLTFQSLATVTYGTVSLSSTNSGGITLGGTDLSRAGLTEAYTAATATFGSGVSTIDISTASGASNAIATLDAAMANVDASRANLGAIQNRFMSVIANLATNSENLSAARSRIRDADFATETANLSKMQILQQAGTAMLAQANSAPQNVLSLLR